MVARSRIALLAVWTTFLGCSGQQEESNTAVPAVTTSPQRPKVSLALKAPTDPKAVSPGTPLEILCTVTVESGGFEPALVTFQLSELKEESNVLSAYTTSNRTSADNSFTFRYRTDAPEAPGRFTIDAKVVGVDPTLPATGPPPAPAADGTRAKAGARGEFSAPGLTFEVKIDTET